MVIGSSGSWGSSFAYRHNIHCCELSLNFNRFHFVTLNSIARIGVSWKWFFFSFFLNVMNIFDLIFFCALMMSLSPVDAIGYGRYRPVGMIAARFFTHAFPPPSDMQMRQLLRPWWLLPWRHGSATMGSEHLNKLLSIKQFDEYKSNEYFLSRK